MICDDRFPFEGNSLLRRVKRPVRFLVVGPNRHLGHNAVVGAVV